MVNVVDPVPGADPGAPAGWAGRQPPLAEHSRSRRAVALPAGRSRSRRALALLVGTATVAGFVVGGASWSAHRIEANLTARGQAALDTAGLQVTVRYEGLDALLTGTVSHPQQGADAIGTLIRVNGTRRIVSRLTITTGPETGSSGSPAGTGTDSDTTPGTGTGSSTLPAGTITFATQDTTLTADTRSYLDRVTDFLLARPQVTLAVRGHSDASGTDDLNWALSQQRAAAVVAYLVSRQVPTERLRPKAFAATSPVASNATPEGRAANRRVELVIEETR